MAGKLTKETVQKMLNNSNNKVFKKDGFVKVYTNMGILLVDWIKPETLEFAKGQTYDNLEKFVDEEINDIIMEKYKGLSTMQRIEKAEEDLSEEDKRVIASLKNRKFY